MKTKEQIKEEIKKIEKMQSLDLYHPNLCRKKERIIATAGRKQGLKSALFYLKWVLDE